jgi:hypothetical protein
VRDIVGFGGEDERDGQSIMIGRVVTRGVPMVGRFSAITVEEDMVEVHRIFYSVRVNGYVEKWYLCEALNQHSSP